MFLGRQREGWVLVSKGSGRVLLLWVLCHMTSVGGRKQAVSFGRAVDSGLSHWRAALLPGTTHTHTRHRVSIPLHTGMTAWVCCCCVCVGARLSSIIEGKVESHVMFFQVFVFSLFSCSANRLSFLVVFIVFSYVFIHSDQVR